MEDGAITRAIGTHEDAVAQHSPPTPLHIRCAAHLCVAPDGAVFVADFARHVVQALTPTYAFVEFIGAGVLRLPHFVQASDTALAVCHSQQLVDVFSRASGTHLHRIDVGVYCRRVCFTPSGCIVVGVSVCAAQLVRQSLRWLASVYDADGGWLHDVLGPCEPIHSCRAVYGFACTADGTLLMNSSDGVYTCEPGATLVRHEGIASLDFMLAHGHRVVGVRREEQYLTCRVYV
jgi:hypothetical protein